MSANRHSASLRPRPGPRPARCRVLVDFDGTIAPDDPTDRILDRFAAPKWRDLEDDWQAGRMSSRECMQRQAALLRATPGQLDAAIADVRIDPGFHAFVALCRRRGVAITIVSDGFDRVVGNVLKRAGLPIRYFANALEWQGGDRWSLTLPYRRAGCRSDAANCKCAHGAASGTPCVAIGDGRSDFCMAAQADYVIAKGALAEFCCARDLRYASFRNFDDVTPRLAQWLDRHDGWAASAPVSRRGDRPALSGARLGPPGRDPNT
jgi:2,3-diketo-5-methylthio-1-phosphopentane phosphatase